MGAKFSLVNIVSGFPKYDLDASQPEHCFCTSSQCGYHLCQVSSKSFKGLQSGREKKSYGLGPLSMTLNPAIRNIASAHRLSLVNICVRFLRNPSRVTEIKGKKVIWPLTPAYDLESSHPEHCFCTSSQSGKHLCQVSSKSFKGFKSYRTEGKKSHIAFDP